MDKQVSSIAVTLRFADGTECAALLTDKGIQRWGADRDTLGAAVEVTEAMHVAVVECRAFEALEAEEA